MENELIRVAVLGAFGKMGLQTLEAVNNSPNMQLVGAVTRHNSGQITGRPAGLQVCTSLTELIKDVDVVVDFTNSEGAMSAIRESAINHVNVVTGSTGLSKADLEEAHRLAEDHGMGIIVAPNFAIGAVLMIHLAKKAAGFFDYAELNEVHHEAKLDAPSGTALSIAEAVASGKGKDFKAVKAEKETLAGTRGGTVHGISIHSGRLPGRVAHHELVFGSSGQTLTIRHDSINRESFMPGVLLAIETVTKSDGLIVGLENIMEL